MAKLKRVVGDADDSRDGVALVFKQYKAVEKQAKTFNDRQSDLKKRLMEMLEGLGEPDEKGSLWLDLPEEIAGFSRLCRQKRAAQVLDVDIATRIAKKYKVYNKCTKTVVVFDEDEFLGRVYDGEIPEKELKKVYDEKVTWAFVPAK